jgi:hypothetical protein
VPADDVRFGKLAQILIRSSPDHEVGAVVRRPFFWETGDWFQSKSQMFFQERVRLERDVRENEVIERRKTMVYEFSGA